MPGDYIIVVLLVCLFSLFISKVNIIFLELVNSKTEPSIAEELTMILILWFITDNIVIIKL